jgi:hypothetical protein
VLVRAAASEKEFAHCVERAWRLQAPKRLKAERERPAPERQKREKKERARKSTRAKRKA